MITAASPSSTRADAPPIIARGLCFNHGRQQTLQGVDLTVRSGRVLALLGRNGAGKTTTINCLLDFLRPAGGQVRILGRPAHQLRPADKARISYVSEQHGLPAWLTVSQLFDFLRPMYPRWQDETCRSLAGQFQLPLDRAVKKLSRGQQIQAAMIAALASQPELLVLDEPFSGLDAVVREDLMDAIIGMMQQNLWSVLCSSHDLDEVERLADDIAILDDGRIVLRASVALLARHSRLVSSAATESVPPGWITLRADAGSALHWVRTEQDDDAQIIAEARAHWPELPELDIQPATLRALYPALLRSRPWCRGSFALADCFAAEEEATP